MIDLSLSPKKVAKRAKSDHENRIVFLSSEDKKHFISSSTKRFFSFILVLATCLSILSFYFHIGFIWAAIGTLMSTLAIDYFVFQPRIEKSVEKALKKLNSYVAPHRVIKNFIDWKQGDRICLTVHEGNYCANFRGVTDDMRIVLKSGSNLYILPPNYLKHVLNENIDLVNRKREMVETDVKTEIVENAYMDFLQTARNELKQQNDSKFATNQESRTSISN